MAKKSISGKRLDVARRALEDGAEWQDGIAASLVGTSDPTDVAERRKATATANEYRKLYRELS